MTSPVTNKNFKIGPLGDFEKTYVPPSSSSSLDVLVGLIFANVSNSWQINRIVSIEHTGVNKFHKVICFQSQKQIAFSISKLPFGMVYKNCVVCIDFHFKWWVGGFLRFIISSWFWTNKKFRNSLLFLAVHNRTAEAWPRSSPTEEQKCLFCSRQSNMTLDMCGNVLNHCNQ